MDPLELALRRVAARRGLPSPAERRRLRLRAGLSQKELAHAIGCTRAALTRWENGTRGPAPRWIDRYADVLRRLAATVVGP